MDVTARRQAVSVETVYRRLAPIYDLLYGATLQAGRRQAMARLRPRPGETILEVGVGTGLSAVAYPRSCSVVAIDLSAEMLERASARLERRRIAHVSLCRMDAMRLAFADGAFDAVYAPYVMNVVADPAGALREMRRVCRGRIVLLNHFADTRDGALTDWLGRLARRAAVNWDIELDSLLAGAGLAALSVERVNIPRVSSVVVCQRRGDA